ncbi:hypothetical protein CXG81DRAFT_24774 [Caulochytrium protostelioides]|uniref:WD40 repeat-like protein n=1 Tax=Caulochytrium protostelioides TaxID=1555241 RepID=A0A4P9XB21_9FUNG|nr:hypothetical protein CXG81DRAFT_24774 [Caulochytrium protostelioides]|eukprot:RKP02562.1 hypothetical protein CXG81DRAFT_24774 [Caulochytrium protostelioides]
MTQTTVYAVGKKARCLAARATEPDRDQFWVGTDENDGHNELLLLDYDEERGQLIPQTFAHPHAVRWIAAPPAAVASADAEPVSASAAVDRILTCWQDGLAPGGATLWQCGATLPTTSDGWQHVADHVLMPLCRYEAHAPSAPILRMFWGPVEPGRLVGVQPTRLGLYAAERPAALRHVGLPRTTALSGAPCHFTTWAWDPQHAAHGAAAVDTAVYGYDLRAATDAPAWSLAHDAVDAWPVRALDFNPNRPSVLAVATDDGAVQLWDRRALTAPVAVTAEAAVPRAASPRLATSPPRPPPPASHGPAGAAPPPPATGETPLLSLRHHTHAARAVQFHPRHDQLLLTAGSDHRVRLESVVSVSSTPLGRVEPLAYVDSMSELPLPPAGDEAEVPRGGGAWNEDDDEDNDEDDPQADSVWEAMDARDAAGVARPTDGTVAVCDEHEDSAYAVAWSAGDPWVYASVSYNGRVIVNTVPAERKYQILL